MTGRVRSLFRPASRGTIIGADHPHGVRVRWDSGAETTTPEGYLVELPTIGLYERVTPVGGPYRGVWGTVVGKAEDGRLWVRWDDGARTFVPAATVRPAEPFSEEAIS